MSSFAECFPEIAGYESTSVVIGKSGSAVYRFTRPGKPALYLKVAKDLRVAEVEAEYKRLLWLKSRVSVPSVLGFKRKEAQALLLTQALPGVNAVEAPREHWYTVVTALAYELRRLHSIATSDCAFDRTLEVVIDAARKRTIAGLVDESDFDEERQGLRAENLLVLLEQGRPPSEDRVVTHGDACLPNAIFDRDRFSGFVDCGRSGLADRYQDLALASRSIGSNYGPGYAERFFAAYGLASIDDTKLAYYRLLDEFF
jgi:aminoglycoside 3'-phosphotransferase II